MDRPAILEFPRQTQMSREKIASRRPSRNLERKFYRGFARLTDLSDKPWLHRIRRVKISSLPPISKLVHSNLKFSNLRFA